MLKNTFESPVNNNANNIKLDLSEFTVNGMITNKGKLTLSNGKIVNREATIFGKSYQTIYWPLQNSDGETLGMIFLGSEMSGMKKIIAGISISCLIATLLISSLLSVCGIIFFRSLINPLEKKAFYDKLTSIRNREGFEKVFERILLNPPEVGSLFLIDLDCFKEVNDNFGHPVGDELLKRTARILGEVFRSTDAIGRLGGDEFVLFAPTLGDIEVIKRKANELLKNVACDYVMKDGSKLKVTASIGISVYPIHGSNYNSLYHNADIALYTTKENGKNNFTIFHIDTKS